MRRQALVLLLWLTSCATPGNSRSTVLLREARRPSLGPSRSIGRYDAGCIAGARSLPLRGKGYVVMRASRNRFYGHPDLLDFLSTLGSALEESGRGEMLVGDLGQPRGGPMPSGHASHQMGLDADIWFRTAPAAWAASQSETLEAWSVLSEKDPAGPELDSARWGGNPLRLLTLAAADARVERIFVNPTIKLALCAAPGDKLWLAKLRPWLGHQDHFHVRLKCPAGSPGCAAQEPPPQGDGCAEAVKLAEYFRELEEEQKAKPVAELSKLPILPSECDAISTESD